MKKSLLLIGWVAALAAGGICFAEDAKNEAPGKLDTKGVREMTLKQLGFFEYDEEKGGGIPKEVAGLEGNKVRIKGFILQTTQFEKMTEFGLIPELFGCCYGTPPVVQQIVIVKFPKNMAVDYMFGEVWVEGVLHVKEERHDGYTSQIFTLDGSSIKLAK